MSFGTYIKAKRKQLQLTQNKVAELSGIQAPYLSRIENEVDLPPSEEVIIRIAAVLQEDPHSLILLSGRVPTVLQNLILNDSEIFEYLESKYKEGKNRG